MNQANAEQVIQNANINLIAIRTAEIDYFSTFFGNFGTQFALVAGFIVSSVSQVSHTIQINIRILNSKN